MIANFEHRKYTGNERAWTGKYQNLHNLPHWHLECELIYIEQGLVTVSHNNTAYYLQKGEAAFIGSGEVHYIKGSGDSITRILMFDVSVIQELVRQNRLLYPKLKGVYPIPETCGFIRTELAEKPVFYDLKIRGFIRNLMIDIFRGEAITDSKKNKDNTSVENYKNLLNEIEEKYSFITFKDASRFMGLSQPYFSKFFKSISGMTFSRYLNIIRLEKAIEILNNNEEQLSITEIASACGFDTIRHFNRVFKEFTGLTPRQLPRDYVLTSFSLKSMKGNFNPTLPNSRLIED